MPATSRTRSITRIEGSDGHSTDDTGFIVGIPVCHSSAHTASYGSSTNSSTGTSR